MINLKENGFKKLPEIINSITSGENDLIANLSNISAAIFELTPNVNWAGFYRLIDGQLVLGPFQGKIACIRINIGKGVCGTAVKKDEHITVHNVHEFSGHIACDSSSMSEIVIPLHLRNGSIFGVLDIDSPIIGNFEDKEDTLIKVAKKIEKILP